MDAPGLTDSVSVVFHDEALIVVDKPPGMLSQADQTGDLDVRTWVQRWRAARTGQPDPFVGLVHRLDRPASGLMVLAGTPAAAADLSEQFRERLVEKRYLALVEGTVTGIERCADYLIRDGRSMRVTSPEASDAQRAVLHWQSLAQDAGRSLLQVRLETGRRHQIRVQLAHRGHPLVGDMRYGATSELDGQNLALHAYHLALEHPSTGRMHRWTTPPPGNWATVLTPALRAAIQRVAPAA